MTADALPRMPRPALAPGDEARPLTAASVVVIAQLVLACAVVYLYDIEGAAFLRLFLLATAGFAVHRVLPMAYRLPFFVVLSLAGAWLVFGAGDAAWLVATVAVAAGVANLPIPLTARVVALAGMGALLAASRAGLVPSPWSAAVWPILGSMLMFRLVLYVMAMRTEAPDRRPWWAAAYFLMFPNLVFPLFPVVDYQTFRRTYFDRDEDAIYEQGLLWIARGLTHLLIYRFVYYNLIGEAEAVTTLGDLVQFMLATFLLYLRVSGQFHLIVGLLHLFGFRLPETHKLYYLAHSFTELWRRINIYWTDFMMKTVFYPSYFALKRRGPTSALVWSTVAVFVTTWVLHSYQWFWLRGGFPVTPQDVLFWAALGAFVVWGGLRELRAGPRARRQARRFDLRAGLQAAATFGTFCVLWSLWSTESISLWLWMLGAAAEVDGRGILLVGLAAGLVIVLGGLNPAPAAGARNGWRVLASQPLVRTTASLVALIALAQPLLHASVPAPVASALQTLRTSRLNARDLALQHRGYYEQLDVRAQLDAPVGAGAGRQDGAWEDVSQIGAIVLRDDLMLRELRPSHAATWNGLAFTTNRWGMRDRDYSREKPPGVLRIAILGPSHVMGNGVGDGETFEQLVEDRLNREFRLGSWERFEILNFGVDGFSLPQQLALLEDRVFAFAPDVVIATHYVDNRTMTQSFLLHVAERGVPVTPAPLGRLFDASGLSDLAAPGVPLPYAGVRRAAGRLGVPARMPYGEARSRALRLADTVLEQSFARFASMVRQRGATPLVLALNVVIDDVPDEIPLREAIDAAGLPLLDLFDVFPEEQRPALRVAPWDDHPNAAAHRLIADRLYGQLTSALASSGTRPGTAARVD